MAEVTISPEAQERIIRNLIAGGYIGPKPDVKNPQVPSSSETPGGRVVTAKAV